MSVSEQAPSVGSVPRTKPLRTFYPSTTIRCEGHKVFRSQAARDAACLLDVDPSVISWRCMPNVLGRTSHAADFEVSYDDGRIVYVDAHDREPERDRSELEQAARERGASYEARSHDEVHFGFRLKNAKDLLRYGNYTVPLGDRLRLLGALDENGSMPISECLNAFQETNPVAGLAALILHRYLEVDLDDAPLGPETMVRRIAR